jgi:hypothetical protein
LLYAVDSRHVTFDSCVSESDRVKLIALVLASERFIGTTIFIPLYFVLDDMLFDSRML